MELRGFRRSLHTVFLGHCDLPLRRGNRRLQRRLFIKSTKTLRLMSGDIYYGVVWLAIKIVRNPIIKGTATVCLKMYLQSYYRRITKIKANSVNVELTNNILQELAESVLE